MGAAAYELFDTGIGTCGIAWKGSDGLNDPVLVVGFQLPEAIAAQTETLIAEKWRARKSSAVPARIKEIIERVRLHFRGQSQDFREVELAFEGVGQFAQRVYEAARTIPAGETMTYGQVADAAGHPGAARAVGQAMSKNPVPLIIPCHRVLASGGKSGGFSAYGGLSTKVKMLEIEGVTIGPPAVIRSTIDNHREMDMRARKPWSSSRSS